MEEISNWGEYTGDEVLRGLRAGVSALKEQKITASNQCMLASNMRTKRNSPQRGKPYFINMRQRKDKNKRIIKKQYRNLKLRLREISTILSTLPQDKKFYLTSGTLVRGLVFVDSKYYSEIKTTLYIGYGYSSIPLSRILVDIKK